MSSGGTDRTYLIQIQTLFFAQNDNTVENGTNGAFNGGSGAWSATETFRQNIVKSACSISDFTINIPTNNNTADGATMRTRTSSDFMATNAFGNIIVTLDQATGAFTDTTNSDILVRDDSFLIRYTENDSTVTVASGAIALQTI